MVTEYQKMIAGDYYHPSDPELRELVAASCAQQKAFNEEGDQGKGAEIIKS